MDSGERKEDNTYYKAVFNVFSIPCQGTRLEPWDRFCRLVSIVLSPLPQETNLGFLRSAGRTITNFRWFSGQSLWGYADEFGTFIKVKEAGVGFTDAFHALIVGIRQILQFHIKGSYLKIAHR